MLCSSTIANACSITAKADPEWPTSLFNLALSHLNRNELNDARRVAREAIARTELAPYFALEAKIAALQGDAPGRDAALDRAFVESRPVPSLDAWELYWYEAAAHLRGDAALVARAVEARRALASAKPVATLDRGVLPDRAVPFA